MRRGVGQHTGRGQVARDTQHRIRQTTLHAELMNTKEKSRQEKRVLLIRKVQ
jgi:hypothetical protein